METSGQEQIEASRAAVWAALNDPDVLRECIPACESIERHSPTELTATVRIKVGFVSAAFKGAITLSDVIPMESYRITAEGSGGFAGFAKGSCDVRLLTDGDGTLLLYTVDAQIGGKLAMLGSKLIETTSGKLARGFFEKLNAILTRQAER